MIRETVSVQEVNGPRFMFSPYRNYWSSSKLVLKSTSIFRYGLYDVFYGECSREANLALWWARLEGRSVRLYRLLPRTQ
jgi:hypothetical protein